MPTAPPNHKPRLAVVHRPQRPREDRPKTAERGYGSKWQRESREWLKRHPTCVYCGARSECVDHVQDHKGDQRLFWNRNNWAPCCMQCNRIKGDRGVPKLAVRT